jgi:hypothetical protein
MAPQVHAARSTPRAPKSSREGERVFERAGGFFIPEWYPLSAKRNPFYITILSEENHSMEITRKQAPITMKKGAPPHVPARAPFRIFLRERI